MLELHVAPDGSPYADGSPPYPFRSLTDAVRFSRNKRSRGERVVIWLHPGRYPTTEPVRLGPEDSHLTISALEPENPPIIDGGVKLDGWKTHVVGGVTLWWRQAPAERVRSLYVNGQRRNRPRYPLEGHLTMAAAQGIELTRGFEGSLFDGGTAFEAAPGDLPELWDAQDVEVVVPHYWVEERLPVDDISGDHVTLGRQSLLAFRDDAKRTYSRYWLDNVGSALTRSPGSFWIDPHGNRFGLEEQQAVLWYHPLPEESVESVEVKSPRVEQLLVIQGADETPVVDVHISGLRFTYTEFSSLPPTRPPFGVREDWALDPDKEYGSGPQAGAEIPATIALEHVRHSSLRGIEVSHIGGTAISLGRDVHECLVAGAEIYDVGGCGITCGDPAETSASRGNEISDCTVDLFGRTFAQSVGILLTHAAHTVVRHNRISRGRYSGISVGWTWDYGPSEATHNLIEGNLINDLGDGTLSDMGGIYLLGVAPGTVVRRNVVRRIHAVNYGGWGIYLDAGSSHVVVENNIVEETNSQCFHLHFGRENIIRGNWFAYGRAGIISITRPEPTNSMVFYNNTLIAESTPMWCSFPGSGDTARRDIRNFRVFSDANTYYEVADEQVLLAANGRAPAGGKFELLADLSREWQASGRDVSSTLNVSDDAQLPSHLNSVEESAGPRSQRLPIAAVEQQQSYRLLTPERHGRKRLR